MTAQLFNIPTPEPQPEFTDLWQLWPSSRRTSRLQCQAIWNDIITVGYSTRMRDGDSGRYVDIFVPHTSPADIMLGARVYLWTRNEWDNRYIRGLATFLNRGGFLDVTPDDIEAYQRTQAATEERKAAAEANQRAMDAWRAKLNEGVGE